MNLNDLVRDAAELSREAGAFLKNERGRILFRDIDVKGRGDFVSSADRTSEKMIREGLEQLLPGSVVMAEEESPDAGGGEWRWIVDPLDGTTNYLQGLPVYAVSIALEDRRGADNAWGTIVGAVTFLPELDLLFSAVRGEGAKRNGKTIHVRRKIPVTRAMIATGFPFRNHEKIDPYLRAFRKIFLQVANVRRIGSAASDLAWVANGTFDGFWEIGLQPWDIAAGILLIEEAGGIITSFSGGNPLETGWIVGGTREVYEILLEAVRSEFTEEP